MRKNLKIAALFLCKTCHLFSLARYMTKNRLRILCYHGFTNGDEHKIAPGTFMKPETFKSRLDYLIANKFNIVKLDDAIEDLEKGNIEHNSVVVTIDDGFQTTLSLAHPILARRKTPYTIYLTTYYCGKDIPIANLALRYALWKTPLTRATFDIRGMENEYDLTCRTSSRKLHEDAMKMIDGQKTTEEKKHVLRNILRTLDLDAEELLARESLKILAPHQVATLAAESVDFQMHTHRHRFPKDCGLLAEEIMANRAIIAEHTGTDPRHLCYPSGVYCPSMFGALRDCGVKSATTCEDGLSDSRTDLLRIHRYLDSESMHQLEFEALVSGFTYLVKRTLSRMPFTLFKR